MKKGVRVRVVSAFLVTVLIVTYLLAFSAGAADVIENIIIANKVSSLCEQATMMNYNNFTQE